jgi:rhodanese-related sulfurtransferase
MEQLSEYIQHHWALAGGAVAALVAVLYSEFRHATRAHGALPPSEVVRLVNDGALLIDVREQSAFEAGHIANARNVPGAAIAAGAPGLERWKDKYVIAYCDTGVTAGSAARQLARLGFTKAYNLRGGLAEWRRENLPTSRGSR